MGGRVGVGRGILTDAPEERGTVTGLNHDGDGVLREGKTAFVPGALPGEVVRFRRVRRHRQHDEARLVAIETASPDRVEPACAHFGVCGGCALQHLAPAAQLQAKSADLAQTLRRIGQVEPESWLPAIDGPAWRYRRRARLGVRFVPKRGRTLVGFRERAKPFVAALERCEILAPPADGLVAPLSELLTGLASRESIAQIEVAVGDAATVLVMRNLQPLPDDDRARLLAFERAHGIRFYLQSGGLDTVAPLQGAPAELSFSIAAFGLEIAFQPTDFVQVNAAVNRELVAAAVALLGAGPGDRVLDLFCGLGNFTLALARAAGEVVGAEGDAALVERAARNADRNGIDNVAFHVADLSVAPDAGVRWLQGSWSHVLLDPPRAGAEALVPMLAKIAPRRVVYVSCHPGTLARDAGLLVNQHGWRLRAAGVVDMFPHTTHVESIAVLEPG
jgi:23S rRNA (uracil1939-C5)-methyltransferase